jgi:hypothetical protein
MMPGSSVVPLWVLLVPPAAYLMAIAVAHLGRRPIVVTGAWDLTLLATALAAPVVAGPVQQLLPSVIRGPYRPLLGLVGFALAVLTTILATRPRLVVYNATLEQLRPVVAEVATSLDPTARWAGETVALPGRDIQVHLDGRGGMRSVSLVAVGSRTSPESWAEFSRHIRRAIRQVPVRPSAWAGVFAAAAMLLLAAATALALWPRIAALIQG